MADSSFEFRRSPLSLNWSRSSVVDARRASAAALAAHERERGRRRGRPRGGMTREGRIQFVVARGERARSRRAEPPRVRAADDGGGLSRASSVQAALAPADVLFRTAKADTRTPISSSVLLKIPRH